MTQTCTICRHEQRTEIEIAIVRRAPYRDIEGRFKVSKSAVARHAEVHLPEALAKSEEARKVADADTVLQQMVHLRDKALGILDRSEEAEDSKTALQAIREARSCVELIAKVTGELDEKSEEDSDLVALRELVDQVRAHGGDMPRGKPNP